MATIILMRHGQIPQSEPRRFVGQRDMGLDSEGQRQADRAAEWLRLVLGGLPRLEAVVHSGLTRTRQTGEVMARSVEAPLEKEDSLREISLGLWEGLSKEEVKERFPSAFEARGQDLAGHAPEGGESFAELQVRAFAGLEAIAERTSGTRVVVAHAGVNRALLCHLLGMPLGGIFTLGQSYCCCNLLTRVEGAWTVHTVNLTPWSFGGLPPVEIT